MAEYPERGINEGELYHEIRETFNEIISSIDKVSLYAEDMNNRSDTSRAIKTYANYISNLKQVEKLLEFGMKYFDRRYESILENLGEIITNADTNLEKNIEIILADDDSTKLCFDVIQQEWLIKLVS